MNSLQGQLLVAAPNLIDPNFFRTVILLVQHSKDGALGLVLNRPTQTTIREAWQQVGESACSRDGVLQHGGPCEGPLMVVHNLESAGHGEFLPNLYFSTDKDEVEQIIAHEDGDARFFVGYAGWSAGQLENELETGSWLSTPAGSEHVFHDDIMLWENAMRAIARRDAFPNLPRKLVPKDPRVN